jgi:hypothetical protein
MGSAGAKNWVATRMSVGSSSQEPSTRGLQANRFVLQNLRCGPVA